MSIDNTANALLKGDKSVLKPSAQITKLCHTGSVPEVDINPVHTVLLANQKRLGRYFIIFMIQLRSGCRISEVLNISSLDISENGSVLIKALKGGLDRVVFVPEAYDYFMRCRVAVVDPFTYFNRFQAYRHLKNIGIGRLKAGRVNSSVTHIFRDLHVKEVRSIARDKATVSRNLGHKSQQSTEYYGKD